MNSAETVPPNPQGDHLVAERASRYFLNSTPGYCCVYLGTDDVYGHAHGWMSDRYLLQLERVDHWQCLSRMETGRVVLLERCYLAQASSSMTAGLLTTARSELANPTLSKDTYQAIASLEEQLGDDLGLR